MTNVINIFYPNLPSKNYGKVAKEPTSKQNYQLPNYKGKEAHINWGFLCEEA
jgi:hypothetical protein